MDDMLSLKSEVLTMIAGQGEKNDQNMQNLFGLDLLHRAVFHKLMQFGMVDDLFALKSPFLQEFIEREMV